MDEKPNVNNLNGVPNFGHGFPEEPKAEEPVEETTSEETKDEGVVLSETNEE